MNTYPDPTAILVCTPEGDYMSPWTGQSAMDLPGGATLLDQWQVDDLLERGYQFA